MKKITKIVLTIVGLAAGTLMLGGSTNDIADIAWFGRFCLAGLVAYASYKLYMACDGGQEPSKQAGK